MLLNAAKCQGYNFYPFRVITEKTTGREVTLPFHTPFFCHHNFSKKGHSKISKKEPENIPSIKIIYLQRDLKD